MKKTRNSIIAITVILCMCIMPFLSGCAKERADDADISVSADLVAKDNEKMESNISAAEISDVMAISGESGNDEPAKSDEPANEKLPAAEEAQENKSDSSPTPKKDAVMQLPEGSFDEVNAKLAALQDWIPENPEDEDLKWSMYRDLMDLQSDFAQANGALLGIPVTTQELLLSVDYRIENDEMMIRQELDSDGEIAHELEELKAFRDEVADSDPSALRELWDTYWRGILSQEPPAGYIFE